MPTRLSGRSGTRCVLDAPAHTGVCYRYVHNRIGLGLRPVLGYVGCIKGSSYGVPPAAHRAQTQPNTIMYLGYINGAGGRFGGYDCPYRGAISLRRLTRLSHSQSRTLQHMATGVDDMNSIMVVMNVTCKITPL